MSNPVDDYLARVEEPAQSTLRKLAADIRAAIPDAEETTTYGMPGFRYHERPLAGFAAFQKHCGLFPMSPPVIAQFQTELAAAKFTASKGGIQFPLGKPFPVTLLKKIVRARAAEIDAKAAPASRKKAKPA